MTRNLIISGLVCIATVASFPAATSYAQVTPEQIARMKSVISSTVSDNGQYVAYTISNPADPKKENAYGQAQLYVLNTLNNQATPFYTSASASQVTFRPSKGTITFLSRSGNDKINALYEISIKGGEARKIFTYTANIQNYSWSPDGEKIAFISGEKEQKPQTTLTYTPTFFEEEYATNNTYIANVAGNASKPQKMNLNGGSAYLLQWSPDGTKIAVSVAPTSSVDDSYMAQKVKVVNAATGNIISHINNQGKLSQIEWSPDSRHIALLGAYDLHDPTNGCISIVGVDGGIPQVIDADFKGKYESVSWKDNRHLHFLASEGTGSAIGTIQKDGRNKQFIYQSSVHHITSFSVQKGIISFTASTPQHPGELFTISEAKRASLQRRTESNPWLIGLQLGRQEVITYKARDGKYDIQGMLIYPLGYREGTRVPLITVVHGGPESHYSNGWLTAYSMPGQMAAAKGYAVFYPNYRGSTGRGVDFTYSSQGDLAGKEFDDIVDGVDYLIEKGIADKKRIGVTGGSYGGYASAWMSTYYSDRFAAAVMFVGISNNISKFGTSDIPTEMKLVHERGNVWDNWQKQLEISPIYYVDRAKTPILIMHGADDPRVHPAQSMELYRHLKVRKPELPVRLIYYPGEGHGNARSGSRYDYNLRMMQWFDTYLKTGNPKEKMPSLDLPQ